MQINVKAHAKINLTLKVLGKRADGYHELETVMQTLALHDVVTLTPRVGEITLGVKGEAPAGKDNLVYRAAELLQQYTGCRQGAAIVLEKNIPMAAGLAGGSADGAATLWGLNKLWNLGLKPQELLILAAQLGSDVPFCLQGGTVLARGRGEKLTPLPDAPRMGVLLVKPNFGVSTAAVYQGFASVKPTKRPDAGAMEQALFRQDPVAVAAELANDLEYVTLAMFPQLQRIKDQLHRAGATGVLMSGSGPTIFCLTPVGESKQLAENLNISDAQVIATTTFQPQINC